MAELETGDDVAMLLEYANFVEGRLNRYRFKEIFQTIGGNDLATKLEIYTEAGW